MKDVTPKRLAIEVIVVVLSAIAFALFIYSELFRICCKHIEVLFFPVALPALRFGAWLSGKASASTFYFAVGMVGEFLILWGAVRAYRWFRSRSANRVSGPGTAP